MASKNYSSPIDSFLKFTPTFVDVISLSNIWHKGITKINSESIAICSDVHQAKKSNHLFTLPSKCSLPFIFEDF
jgi:hypothetical protein